MIAGVSLLLSNKSASQSTHVLFKQIAQLCMELECEGADDWGCVTVKDVHHYRQRVARVQCMVWDSCLNHSIPPLGEKRSTAARDKYMARVQRSDGQLQTGTERHGRTLIGKMVVDKLNLLGVHLWTCNRQLTVISTNTLGLGKPVDRSSRVGGHQASIRHFGTWPKLIEIHLLPHLRNAFVE
jgi:hypothetical protein